MEKTNSKIDWQKYYADTKKVYENLKSNLDAKIKSELENDLLVKCNLANYPPRIKISIKLKNKDLSHNPLKIEGLTKYVIRLIKDNKLKLDNKKRDDYNLSAYLSPTNYKVPSNSFLAL
jgi:hypothetical protein